MSHIVNVRPALATGDTVSKNKKNNQIYVNDEDMFPIIPVRKIFRCYRL